MKKILRLATVLMFTLSLIACSGSPTFDTSSEDTMTKSMEKIMAELSPEDQKRFTDTIAGIYLLGALASLGENKSQEEILAPINARLNGKTAEEIFAVADEIHKEMKN